MRDPRTAPRSALLLALAAATLVACGGGGGSTPPPPTHAISGKVTGSVTASVTVKLTGTATATTTTAADGTFAFAGLADGAYTVTPSVAALSTSFAPASLAVTLAGADATGKDFVAASSNPAVAISGTITGAVKEGVTIWLVGEKADYSADYAISTITDAAGKFAFVVDSPLDGDLFSVRPFKPGYAFSPPLRKAGSGYAYTGRDATAAASAIAGLSAGNSHSLVVKTDGSLWGWGANNVGNLGVAAATNTSRPVKLGDGYATASGGIGHTVALKVDGEVWVWGWNSEGQLGLGTTGGQSTPVRLGARHAHKAVAAEYGGFFIDAGGTLRGWGRNANGTVGDGTTIGRSAPVLSDYPIFDVFAGQAHVMAFGSLGDFGWGFNQNGQAGNGTVVDLLDQPASGVGNPTNFPGAGYVDYAPGAFHTLALDASGVLWGWGNNFYGQLGDGTQLERLDRVQIMTGVAAIASHDSHSLALKTDGSLWAWGKNASGQVGNGSTADVLTPVQIGTGYARIACGSDHSLAVKTDGTVWAWGLNNFGQLGDGTTTSRTTPHQVPAF